MARIKTEFERQLEFALYAIEYDFGRTTYLGRMVEQEIEEKDENLIGLEFENMIKELNRKAEGENKPLFINVCRRIATKLEPKENSSVAEEYPIRVVYDILIEENNPGLIRVDNKNIDRLIKQSFDKKRLYEIAGIQILDKKFKEYSWNNVEDVEALEEEYWTNKHVRSYNPKQMTSIIANELIKRDKFSRMRI